MYFKLLLQASTAILYMVGRVHYNNTEQDLNAYMPTILYIHCRSMHGQCH